MTTLLEPARWLPSRDAADRLACHRDTLVGKLRAGLLHGHNHAPGTRYGSWFVDARVARAAADGEPIETQVRLCGCRSGATPPHVRGGARRSRHP